VYTGLASSRRVISVVSYVGSVVAAAATITTQQGNAKFGGWTMREFANRHHVAGMEFVGVDKSVRCGKGGHCRSGQCRSGQIPVKNVLKTSWKSPTVC